MTLNEGLHSAFKVLLQELYCAPVALKKFWTFKRVEKKVLVRWLPWIWRKWFINSKRQDLLMYSLEEGGKKKKCSRSVKEVITAVQESSSGVQVCSAREIAEHWTGLWHSAGNFMKHPALLSIQIQPCAEIASCWPASKRDFCFRIFCSHRNGE